MDCEPSIILVHKFESQSAKPTYKQASDLMIWTKIKHALRRMISVLPGGAVLIQKRANLLERKRLARIGDRKQVFSHHYEVNAWDNEESVSGPGSTIEYTENIRVEIPKLVKELGVSQILDAPCGDYNWFRKIEWETDITYLGGDIVEPLVESNQRHYENQTTQFINLDIIQDELPAADLWLCRDCLFHLSNRDVLLVLDNFLKSKIRYLLTSVHPNCEKNADIPTGSFRLLNLQLPPFRLSKPLKVMDDWIEGYPVRELALWDRESLKHDLAENKVFQRTINGNR